MPEIVVTTDPVNVANALGLDAYGLWVGECQNTDASETVYRAASATKPDPAATAGFRHRPGEFWSMTVYGEAPVWLWTVRDQAIVVLEP